MRFEQHITQEREGEPVQVKWTVSWTPIGWPRMIIGEGNTIVEAFQDALIILEERAA